MVSVNLAARQVAEPGLVDDIVQDACASAGLPPTSLQLELTESAIMGTTGEPLGALRKLVDIGVRIAIDDFGTGYSNLSYLRHLPVHALKIAGSFVEGLRAGRRRSSVDAQIVTALVSLAHTLKLDVIAEGVETREQADRLRRIGCDSAQGWLYAKPGPPEEINPGSREVPRPGSCAATGPAGLITSGWPCSSGTRSRPGDLAPARPRRRHARGRRARRHHDRALPRGEAGHRAVLRRGRVDQQRRARARPPAGPTRPRARTGSAAACRSRSLAGAGIRSAVGDGRYSVLRRKAASISPRGVDRVRADHAPRRDVGVRVEGRVDHVQPGVRVRPRARPHLAE